MFSDHLERWSVGAWAGLLAAFLIDDELTVNVDLTCARPAYSSRREQVRSGSCMDAPTTSPVRLCAAGAPQ